VIFVHDTTHREKWKMLVQPFKTAKFNQHYDGAYSAEEIEWRHICAMDKVSNIQALLGGKNVGSVLEIGCGTGAVLSELRKRGVGASHQGIDLAEPDKHVDPDARDLSLLEYDGETIPFPNDSFDFAYASHVVEHVLNPRGFIGEISRVTRRLVYLEIPCELHARTKHSDMQNTLNIGHINSYSPESFSMLCQTAGLKIIDSQLFDHSFDVHAFHSSSTKAVLKMKIRRALLSAHPIFASRIFTYHFGVLCAPVR
jgi:ubiquinone/menaquinone biosynthesis C-methylase UbiE